MHFDVGKYSQIAFGEVIYCFQFKDTSGALLSWEYLYQQGSLLFKALQSLSGAIMN